VARRFVDSGYALHFHHPGREGSSITIGGLKEGSPGTNRRAFRAYTLQWGWNVHMLLSTRAYRHVE